MLISLSVCSHCLKLIDAIIQPCYHYNCIPLIFIVIVIHDTGDWLEQEYVTSKRTNQWNMPMQKHQGLHVCYDSRSVEFEFPVGKCTISRTEIIWVSQSRLAEQGSQDQHTEVAQSELSNISTVLKWRASKTMQATEGAIKTPQGYVEYHSA